jgi:hypothetical protein
MDVTPSESYILRSIKPISEPRFHCMVVDTALKAYKKSLHVLTVLHPNDDLIYTRKLKIRPLYPIKDTTEDS